MVILMNLNEFNEMNDNSDLFLNSKNIINSFQKKAYQEINKALIHQNWLIGYRIAEELKDKILLKVNI